jgi:hypothetical protein
VHREARPFVLKKPNQPAPARSNPQRTIVIQINAGKIVARQTIGFPE